MSSSIGTTRSGFRLLLTCDSLSIGGGERHVVGLATALRRHGHEVTVACSGGGPLGHDLAAAGVRVLAIPDQLIKRRVSVGYARGLVSLVEREAFDLVHAHMHASAAAAAIACARADIPLVITEHSEASWRDERAWRTSRSAYDRAAHVIAVSGAIARRLAEVHGVHATRVSVIPNALPPDDRRYRLPERARPAPGEPLIGAVARLVPEKGVASFLRAMPVVLRALPRAGAVIVGDGPIREELIALARDLGIAQRVRFLGARIDGPRLISQLDVLVIPSLSEGTPLVTLEALGAGVAIVATAVGGIPEQLRGFDRAALVPPDHPMALARALIGIARTGTRRSPVARQEIGLLPGHEAMVRQTESVYARVQRAARPAVAAVGAPHHTWLVH